MIYLAVAIETLCTLSYVHWRKRNDSKSLHSYFLLKYLFLYKMYSGHTHTHTPPRSSPYPTYLFISTHLPDHHHTHPTVHLYALEYIHNCPFADIVLCVAIVYFSRSSVILVVRFWRKRIVLAIHFCVLWFEFRNLEF